MPDAFVPDEVVLDVVVLEDVVLDEVLVDVPVKALLALLNVSRFAFSISLNPEVASSALETVGSYQLYCSKNSRIEEFVKAYPWRA